MFFTMACKSARAVVLTVVFISYFAIGSGSKSRTGIKVDEVCAIDGTGLAVAYAMRIVTSYA